MRDAMLWGGGALCAVLLAAGSFFVSNSPVSQTAVSLLAGSQPAGVDKIITGSVEKPRWQRSDIVRQPFPENNTTVAVRRSRFSPASQPRVAPTELYGIDLGTSHSFSALGKRYSSMVDFAPSLFTALEPRASIVDVDNGIEAHLIAGPFDDKQGAQQRCNDILQRINTQCSPVRFVGRALNVN